MKYYEAMTKDELIVFEALSDWHAYAHGLLVGYQSVIRLDKKGNRRHTVLPYKKETRERSRLGG